MRGVYTAHYELPSGITAARTLMYLTAPSGLGVQILEARVGNKSNATAEMIDIGLYRITTLGTPTATSVTPEKMEQGDQAAGSTVAANVTASEPTYHTVAYDVQGLSNLSQYSFRPLDEQIYVFDGASVGLRLVKATIASTIFQIMLKFKEFG